MYPERAFSVLHLAPMQVGGIDRHVRDIVASVECQQAIWHVSPTLDVLELAGAPRFIPIAASLTQSPGATALAEFLRASRVGIVHVHSLDAATRGRLAWLRAEFRLPYLVTLHDVSFLDPQAFDRAGVPAADAAWVAELRPVIEGAAQVIAPSAFIRDLAAGAFPEARLAVIPNGLGAEARARPPLPPRPELRRARPEARRRDRRRDRPAQGQRTRRGAARAARGQRHRPRRDRLHRPPAGRGLGRAGPPVRAWPVRGG